MICYYHQRSEPKALRLALSGTRAAEVMVRWWPKATTHAEWAQNSIMQNQINKTIHMFKSINSSSLHATVYPRWLASRKCTCGSSKMDVANIPYSDLASEVCLWIVCSPLGCAKPTHVQPPNIRSSQLEAGPTKPISLGRDIPINPSYYSYTPRYCQPHV